MPHPAPAPTWHTAEVDGATVEYLVAGRGDPMVFLHGWGLTPRIYVPAVTRLCAAGIRVIAPSLPGFGGSDRPDEMTLPSYAERVARFLESLSLESPAFVMGHSFGGAVAIQLATDHAELVRSLTLLNTVGGSPGRPGLRRQAGMTSRPWWQWAVAAMAEVSPRALLKLRPATVRHMAGSLARDIVPNLVRRPGTMAQSVLLALSVDLAAQAQALVDSGMPVLFVWGDRDRLITPGAFASIESRMPPEIVEGTHGWLLTSPGEFGQLLHNALVVHALLERTRRGQSIVLPKGASLEDLFPPERRRRARHEPGVDEPGAPA